STTRPGCSRSARFVSLASWSSRPAPMHWRLRNWLARCWPRSTTTTSLPRRSGARAALRSFGYRRESLRAALIAVRIATRRMAAARNRLLAMRARHDTRAWQVKRRERTRHLIELGGLVAKAGLVELTDDDRAVIFGLMIEAAAALRSDHRDDAL